MLQDLTVVKRIVIRASAEAVWDALVDPDKIREYFFGTNTVSEWKEGSTLEFTGEWQGTRYRDAGTIRTFRPPQVLSYDYHSSFSPLPDAPENRSLITFTIERAPEGCTLHLEQRGFPDETAREHSETSWNAVLDGLKNVAERG